MKKGIIWIAMICLFFSVSCNNAHKTSGKNSETDTVSTSVIDSSVVFADRIEVNLNLEEGYAQSEFHKNERQAIHLKFSSKGYTGLYAAIKPKDSTANIRFNQIIMPDSTADGPFGHDIRYDLNQNGIYTLIIDKSLMAGTPSEGDFKIEIKLNK